MVNDNTWIMVLVAAAAIALILFLILRNRRDRRELLPPDITGDATEKTKDDIQRRDDKL